MIVFVEPGNDGKDIFGKNVLLFNIMYCRKLRCIFLSKCTVLSLQLIFLLHSSSVLGEIRPVSANLVAGQVVWNGVIIQWKHHYYKASDLSIIGKLSSFLNACASFGRCAIPRGECEA